jgi:colanic acid/amylovoran biosynthesis protein
MTKILFIGGNLSKNIGGAAIVSSACRALKEVIPDTEFTLLSFLPKYDFEMSTRYPNIHIISELDEKKYHLPLPLLSLWLLRLLRSIVWKAIYKLFGLNVRKLIDEKILKEYANSDIIIEISGDGLTGDYGFFGMFISFPRILVCTLLKKPVVIYAQSIGPYNIKWPILNKESTILSRFCRYFARYLLNKVNLITVREEITLNILKSLRITKPPIYLTADSAFLLPPTPKERVYEILSSYGVDHGEKIIGVSVSGSISRLQYKSKSKVDYNHYKNVIIQIIDYLTDKLDVRVILVPHETGPGIMSDDRFTGAEIHQKLKNKKKVVQISEELSPEETKGIIGRCDLFIGSRMHANIAALSMAVPTIAIGYSHKTWGIMKMMEQEEFICDFQEVTVSGIMKMMEQEEFICDFQEVTVSNMMAKLDRAWQNKEKISEELKQRTKIVQERAFYNAILVKQLLES